eukprot:gene24305-29385_t
MVEGPKVLLKKERLRAGLQNKVIECLVTFSHSTTPTQGHCVPFEGGGVVDVVCVGKELFIVLDQEGLALRLHFGMSGTEQVFTRPASESPFIPNNTHAYKPLAAYILFRDKVLYLYDTQVTLKRDFKLSYVAKKLSLDVLSDMFKPALAHEKIRRDSRAIQDVLLDQDVLPGVGNIIKCEGLFRCGVHPDAPAHSLSEDTIHHLIHHTGSFAKEWLAACKVHKKPAYGVYGQELCGRCGSAVRLVRSSTRITYYCARCQPLGTNTHNGASQGLPSAAYSSEQNHADETIPSLCHPPLCACTAPLPTKLARVHAKSSANLHRIYWTCAKTYRQRCSFFQWADTGFPKCPTHSAHPCTIRRVLKDSAHNGRHFFACSTADCKFFMWAADAAGKTGERIKSNDAENRMNNNCVEDVPVAKRPRISIPL